MKKRKPAVASVKEKAKEEQKCCESRQKFDADDDDDQQMLHQIHKVSSVDASHNFFVDIVTHYRPFSVYLSRYTGKKLKWISDSEIFVASPFWWE